MWLLKLIRKLIKKSKWMKERLSMCFPRIIKFTVKRQSHSWFFSLTTIRFSEEWSVIFCVADIIDYSITKNKKRDASTFIYNFVILDFFISPFHWFYCDLQTWRVIMSLKINKKLLNIDWMSLFTSNFHSNDIIFDEWLRINLMGHLNFLIAVKFSNFAAKIAQAIKWFAITWLNDL